MHIRHLVAVVAATLLAACAGAPKKPDAAATGETDTVFVAENISVTYSGCKGNSPAPGRDCAIVAIESTSTAPTGGPSATNRRNAMDAACSYALANARHWMGERVDSARVTERSGTSTEKSSGGGGRAGGPGDSVDGFAIDAANDTRTTVRNIVRRNASGYMTGWSPSNQEAVGEQEVRCTMKWSRLNAELMRQATGPARR